MKIDLNDQRHMGELGLHIMSVNDMDIREWMDFFEDVETIQYALEDELNFIARNVQYSDKIREALDLRLEELQSTSSAETETIMGHTHTGDARGDARVPTSNLIHSIDISAPMPFVGSQLQQVPVVGGKEIVVTDKGAFYCIPVLKAKLQVIYNLDNFDEVFTSALDAANVDLDVDYVSEVKKKSIVSKMKKCVKEAINDKLDNVMNKEGE